MGKKMRKAIKRLAKDLEEAREENRELIEGLAERVTEALEQQAESNRALIEALEDRLSTSEGSKSSLEPDGEDLSLQKEEEPDSPEEGLGESDAQEEEPEVTETAERKAGELGVDLADVKGTGSGGRILVTDVEAAAG